MATTTSAEARRDQLVERVFGNAIGAMELLCIYVGDQLGLYRALADRGASTSAELADVAGIHERYAREWLEQQAMAGVLETPDPDASDTERHYALPAGHDEALLEGDSLNSIAPLAQAVVACALPVHALLEAFRTGAGISFGDYGADMHEGQARFTQPLFKNLLAREWFPAIPAIHERLQADPPARVADVACGLGRSSIAIARAYPKATVDGIDLDEASIARAQELHGDSGVADRVTFRCQDAAHPDLAGRYDLVTIFEALHDMARPVDALRATRGMLDDHGYVLVADERAAERFALDAGDVERLYYGFSVLHCLPVGMTGEDPAGTGTVFREDTLRAYASEAGFTEVHVAAVENDFWRFYLLSG
jgi:SAM-dependent methyltransferase